MLDYVRMSSENLREVENLRDDIWEFGYGDTEFFIVLAIGEKGKDSTWIIDKYIVFDGNTPLLAIWPLTAVTHIPCKVIYTKKGVF